jgi:hypothetical protein
MLSQTLVLEGHAQQLDFVAVPFDKILVAIITVKINQVYKLIAQSNYNDSIVTIRSHLYLVLLLTSIDNSNIIAHEYNVENVHELK